MMSDDPSWLKLLERMGFNVTKLRWRLYRMEQRRGQERRWLPQGLRWMEYEHTICLHCGAIVPKGDRACPKCERAAPSPLGYRLYRLAGLVFPEEAPVVTGAFLGVSLILFGLGYMLESPDSDANETLFRLGAFLAVEGIGWQDLWRGLSFGVLHFGVIHLGFNCFALFQVGPMVEAEVGRRRMLVLITITQITSAIGTYAWYVMVQNEYAFTVGASGWLFGLIGFGVGFCHSQGPIARVQRNFFLQWAAYVFVFGLLLGANNAAHAGGFLGGVPVGMLIHRQRYPSARQWTAWNALFLISLLLWAGTGGMMAYTTLQPQ